MERAEIIKALECCNEKHTCSECPYCNNCYDGKIIEMSLALIKEQQKELTYCYNKLTELEKECLGLSLHNITLKKEKKYLRESLAEEAEIKEDMSVSELKAEIERLNKEVDKRVPKLIITKKPKGAGNV